MPYQECSPFSLKHLQQHNYSLLDSPNPSPHLTFSMASHIAHPTYDALSASSDSLDRPFLSPSLNPEPAHNATILTPSDERPSPFSLSNTDENGISPTSFHQGTALPGSSHRLESTGFGGLVETSFGGNSSLGTSSTEPSSAAWGFEPPAFSFPPEELSPGLSPFSSRQTDVFPPPPDTSTLLNARPGTAPAASALMLMSRTGNSNLGPSPNDSSHPYSSSPGVKFNRHPSQPSPGFLEAERRDLAGNENGPNRFGPYPSATSGGVQMANVLPQESHSSAENAPQSFGVNGYRHSLPERHHPLNYVYSQDATTLSGRPISKSLSHLQSFASNGTIPAAYRRPSNYPHPPGQPVYNAPPNSWMAHPQFMYATQNANANSVYHNRSDHAAKFGWNGPQPTHSLPVQHPQFQQQPSSLGLRYNPYADARPRSKGSIGPLDKWLAEGESIGSDGSASDRGSHTVVDGTFSRPQTSDGIPEHVNFSHPNYPAENLQPSAHGLLMYSNRPSTSHAPQHSPLPHSFVNPQMYYSQANLSATHHPSGPSSSTTSALSIPPPALVQRPTTSPVGPRNALDKPPSPPGGRGRSQSNAQQAKKGKMKMSSTAGTVVQPFEPLPLELRPISLVTGKPKRPRRKHDQVERLYACEFAECGRSYGTLNHLNTHIISQKHGEKRTPAEFRELRRLWRRKRKEEASKHAPPKQRSTDKKRTSSSADEPVLPPGGKTRKNSTVSTSSYAEHSSDDEGDEEDEDEGAPEEMDRRPSVVLPSQPGDHSVTYHPHPHPQHPPPATFQATSFGEYQAGQGLDDTNPFSWSVTDPFVPPRLMNQSPAYGNHHHHHHHSHPSQPHPHPHRPHHLHHQG